MWEAAARELLSPSSNFETVWKGLGLMELLEVEVTPKIMKFCFCLFPGITDLARAVRRRGTVRSQHPHGDQELHSSPFHRDRWQAQPRSLTLSAASVQIQGAAD